MRTTTSSPPDSPPDSPRDGVPAASAEAAGRPGGGYSRAACLPGDPRAAAAARQFVRTVFADWTAQALPGSPDLTERLADEAVLLVSELVTNAVVHAGTAVELRCRLEPSAGPGPYDHPQADPDGLDGTDRTGVVIEVSDHHPARPVRAREEATASEGGGHGLQLISAVAESWGITYRRAMKTVWFRLPADPDGTARPEPEGAVDNQLLQRGLRAAELLAPTPRRAVRQASEGDWVHQGALSFLAEASDLLSGQLDADQVASLAAQLTVPRLADWCAVWLYDGDGGAPGRGIEADGEAQRLARVWHSSESRIDSLRTVLEKDPPPMAGGDTGLSSTPTAVRWPWPPEPGGYGPGGAALACPLVAGGRRLGTLLLGRSGLLRFPDEVIGLVEDLCRRVARAMATARAYSRQERISQVLQRRLLPRGRAQVPGVESAVVYEPREGAWAGGDFWDLFDAGDGRWCFALGDVCGSGPEAAAVTGLARPVLRLLARDGFGVAEVLDRLNKTMAREAADSVAAVAAAVAAAGAGAEAPVEIRDEGEQARFLSLLYGEIVPYHGGSGGARCTLASAGHPLPLVLGADGAVRVVAAPQMLLGVVEDAAYVSESFDLCAGETLLCVTDGVTERRSDGRLFDDEDGLTTALAACTGLGATAIAEHIRSTVHAFAPTPPDDDLALLVLQAAGPATAAAGAVAAAPPGPPLP
ncbi:SpoIIE family protein phosphatase [Streptomyces sp. NPDC101150]|uniref:SpoIIE family protein phosphatase n=1 Tax=Streptomyces sp. NPDC101150 TaxID=3366114 RepID=UPI003812F3BB